MDDEGYLILEKENESLVEQLSIQSDQNQLLRERLLEIAGSEETQKTMQARLDGAKGKIEALQEQVRVQKNLIKLSEQTTRTSDWIDKEVESMKGNEEMSYAYVRAQWKEEQGKVKETGAELARALQDKEKLEGEKRKVEAEKEKVDEELLDKAIETATMTTERNLFKQSSSATAATLAAQKLDVEETNSELEDKSKQLQNRITELEVLNKQLQARATELEDMSTKFQTQVIELEVLNKQFQTRATELEDKSTKFQTQVIELEVLNKQLRTRATEVGEKSTKFQTQVIELEVLNKQFQTRATELEDKSTKFQTQVIELEVLNKQFQTRATELEDKSTNFQTQVIELEVLNKQLQTRATELEDKSTKFQTQVIELEVLNKQLQTRVTELEAFENKSKQLQDEMQPLKEEKQRLDSRNKELEPLVAKNLDLNSRMSHLEALEDQVRLLSSTETKASKALDAHFGEMLSQETGDNLKDKIESLSSVFNGLQRDMADRLAQAVPSNTASTFKELSVVLGDELSNMQADKVALQNSNNELAALKEAGTVSAQRLSHLLPNHTADTPVKRVHALADEFEKIKLENAALKKQVEDYRMKDRVNL
ncbi:hypothetical protein EG327_003426 [Venturia inaequalis]|uniref:Uncharacterized protein n=1 Tax=Venturia inaequalis TaxID=5025 RepID=A0A8H3VIU1_VENIN|nr:hypothetical protein EG327_003426 [Venturia inaequalis]